MLRALQLFRKLLRAGLCGINLYCNSLAIQSRPGILFAPETQRTKLTEGLMISRTLLEVVIIYRWT
jgi:hypothetical protein